MPSSRAVRSRRSRAPVAQNKVAALERAAWAHRSRASVDTSRQLVQQALVVVADLRKWVSDAPRQRKAGWELCLQELEHMAEVLSVEANKHEPDSRMRKSYEDRAYQLRDAILVLRQVGAIKLG